MPQGYLSRLGFALDPPSYEPTWPAATATSIEALLSPLQFAVNGQALIRYQSAREDAIARLLATRTRQEGAANALLSVRYGGLESTWAAALGYAGRSIGGTVFPETVASGAYRHRYELAPRLRDEPWTLADGFMLDSGLLQGQERCRRGTLAALLSSGTVWELRSAMVTGWTLAGAVQAPWTLALDYQGYNVDLASSVNTPASMAALGVPATTRPLWHQSVIRLAPYSDQVALGSGDAIPALAMTLSCAGNMRVAQGLRTGLAAIEQPTRSQLPELTGTLLLQSYDDDTLVAAQQSAIPYMLDMVATGPEIAATGIPYSLAVYLPQVTLTAVTPDPMTAAQPTLAISFTAGAPRLAAAGMPLSNLQPPLLLEVVTDNGAHPLLP